MRPWTLRFRWTAINVVGLIILVPAARAQQAAVPAANGLPSPPTAGAASATPPGSGETVIVTGTREPRRKARDSLSPVDVVTSRDIADTGQTNVTQALVQLLPSVTTPAVGIFDGAPTDFISLRGLNPNQTLVLVDGKRRHASSFIYIDGFADGATPVDVDLIPPSLIDHVEVLRDGAAAQYGSDAIAGVVNIILKSSDHGGYASSEIGQTEAGDGFVVQAGGEKSAKLGSNGFVDLSVDYRHQDHTVRNDDDDRTGTVVNKILGDPASTRYDFGVNAGIDLADGVQLYTTDTYAYRFTDVNQNFRLPSRLPAIYPGGFTPHQTTFENDFSAAFGLRGDDLLGWNWDLSSTYGVTSSTTICATAPTSPSMTQPDRRRPASISPTSPARCSTMISTCDGAFIRTSGTRRSRSPSASSIASRPTERESAARHRICMAAARHRRGCCRAMPGRTRA